MQKITSRDNAKLKAARKARDGRLDNAFFIEGVRLAEEALRSDVGVTDVFVSETLWQSDRAAGLLHEFEGRNVPISLLPDKLFDAVADTKSSQGLIILANRPDASQTSFERRFREDEAKFPLVVLLHEINNPSNLGAILRTADAVGVSGVIITKNSADVFGPKSVRAAMGACFRLNIWIGTAFDATLKWGKLNGLRSVAADIGATAGYDTIDWRRPRLVVFGSEAHGLSTVEFSAVDEGLVIPINPRTESLNLAVAAGIILFEAKRQTK